MGEGTSPLHTREIVVRNPVALLVSCAVVSLWGGYVASTFLRREGVHGSTGSERTIQTYAVFSEQRRPKGVHEPPLQWWVTFHFTHLRLVELRL